MLDAGITIDKVSKFIGCEGTAGGARAGIELLSLPFCARAVALDLCYRTVAWYICYRTVAYLWCYRTVAEESNENSIYTRLGRSDTRTP